MYLKRVEMKGFKSFADNVTLDFKNCITSIIGPNGSGKSNISDAIRWVLGEQSLKNLRGSKSQDIIFSGTQFRKALSFAEVSLILDNNDKGLDVEYDEVSITRRLYRSGESEYLINNNKCRLKDVYTLLLDTGIGKDGYSIIGQGKIEELLSSKSEERRNIFDEAAGIMKYKTRKAEALKKLEKTEENLIRINDIIREIESGLENLKMQAQKARIFIDFRNKLKEYETAVYVRSIEDFELKIKKLNDEADLIVKNISDEELTVKACNLLIQKNVGRQESLESQMESVHKEYREADRIISEKTGDIRVWEEKRKKYTDHVETLKNDILNSKFDMEEIQKNRSKYEKRLEVLNKDLKEYSKALEGFEAEMQEIMATLNENEQEIEKLKFDMMDKLDMITERKTSVASCNNLIDNLASRLKSIEKDVMILIREKDAFFIEKENIEREISASEENEISLNKDISQLNTRLKELNEQYKKNEHNLSETKSLLNTEKSKYNLLFEMEKNYEGYNKSVKAALTAFENRSDANVKLYGTVADIINVEEEYETAVEMALGGAMQNIITEDENDAKTVISYLRRGNHGRVTLMPVSTMTPRFTDGTTLAEMRKLTGFIDTGDKLVTCDNKFTNIIKNLLGRIIIVKDYDSAVKIAKAFSYTYRVVTLEGDTVNTGGSITGGSVNKVASNILSRKRMIGQLEYRIQNFVKREESLLKVREDYLKDISSCNDTISVLTTKKRDVEHERIRLENKYESLLEKIQTHTFKIENGNDEKKRFCDEINKTKQELTNHKKCLNDIEVEIERSKRIISEFEETHKSKRKRKDDLVTDITDYKVSVNSFIESINIINNNLKDTENSVVGLIEEVKRKEDELKKNVEKISIAESNKIQLDNEIKTRREKMTGTNLLIGKLEQEKKSLKDEIEEARSNIDSANKNILLFKEEENRLNIRKTKIESDMDSLKGRMYDEYELTYAEAVLNRREPDEEVTPKKISSLKQQINELGSVHVGAIQEYTDTKTRFDFLVKQKNEMEEAKEKLKRIVYEMNSVMKTKFTGRLNEINKNFRKVFTELFDGGKAELALADSENVLESDIEVFVQPPGKNLQNMMLLSGGERALAAIALLFSIMMLKPAPFCILDEIEAALDDANIYKFIEYLRTLSDKTQFILITHRKGTMEGSDLLYGVTMQEHGVSNIVSMDIGSIEKTG